MLGAIAGDVIGSAHERNPIKTTEFPLFRAACRFTDDTVLTVATAKAILNGEPYGSCYREYGRRYPTAGYGASFYNWMLSDHAGPYNSWGNGSGMRVSPIGFAFSGMQTMLREATRSAEATHNHPEGVKGAQAIAFAILKARKGATREQIRQSIMRRFGYDLTRTLDSIRPHYFPDVSCQGSVPEAILAFLESEDFEHAIRLAVSLGGDSDTLAAMTGGIAQAFYGGVPSAIAEEVFARLPPDFVDVIQAFEKQFSVKR